MRTALVTGGAGFIGARVVRALDAAGYTVAVAGTSASADPLTRSRLAAFDRELELVVHCAGGASVASSIRDPLGDFDKTVPPLAALLEHLRTRAPAARLVVLSSAAVYGAAVSIPTSESCALAPISPYGAHKRICEELCASYGRSFGVASVVLRLFSVYGPGLRKQLMWDACRKARAGELTFAGTGDEERDWLHVDDAASLVIAAAAQASAATPIYNGASGAGVRVRDVVGQIYRELGAGTPRFSGETRAGDPRRYVADVTRSRSLGWSPRVEISRGISELVAWFRELE